MVIFHIAPQDSHLTIQLLMGGLEHIDLDPKGFQLSILFVQRLPQGFCLGVELIQVVMGLLQYKGGGGIVLLCLFGGSGEPVQAVQPHGNLHAL